MILPFKMCLAQRLSTILLLRLRIVTEAGPGFYCSAGPRDHNRSYYGSWLGTSTCFQQKGFVYLPSKMKLFSVLLQHTVNSEVFPLARLSFYENLLIRQETIVRCSHSLRSWWFFGEFFSVYPVSVFERHPRARSN